ncbi:hypothetical protein SPRG_03310 [Saprolegnia parasitica CBS 223.65]|uniref:Cytochrome P450 n=1 Tax=Saprolegnia parasitica (strain CBS 223.65) TaxID=695850 RepID=A0A067CS71_SAPPC|nr:hypothetical protein SPRG_03310 [Saprolegnia parasitica CBS 223.65]KDO32090.1 hypothetical protein SPRG_03310 [Saprolegnia parasitica CBS 223.65]|eukprot:XP_012197277.1 hypothetical protein SPRG_03310 [Saprolegnia parasitica CBS 223.65]
MFTESAVAVAALAVAYVYWRFGRNAPFLPGVPFPASLHQPFLGVAGLLGSIDGCDRLFADAADANGMVSFRLLTTNAVSVLKAAHVRQVVCATSYREMVPILGNHLRKLLGGASLLLLSRHEWKGHRRLIAKAFHWQSLAQMVLTMVAVAEAFVDVALQTAGGASVDVAPLLKLAALDTIGRCAFDYDFEALANGTNDVTSAFEFLLNEAKRRGFDDTLHPASLWYDLPTPANRRYKREARILRSTLESIVVARMSDHATTKHDLLGSLLAAAADESSAVTPTTLADNLLTFLFAGFDTVAIALAYAMHLLSTHPDVQAKALAEVEAVVGRSGSITYEAIGRLPYVYAVMTEALRLFPPGPGTSRTLEADLVLDGHSIPAGTLVYLPIWEINRSRLNWGDDADAFRPERHVEEGASDESSSDRAFRMMSFSAGPRNCVGMRFAMLEAVVVLATTLRRCTLTRSSDAPPVTPKISGILQVPANGVWVRVAPLPPGA